MFDRLHADSCRDPWESDWKEALREIPLRELTPLLKSSAPPLPTYRWTTFGEAAAAFRLAVILGPLKELVLKRSTALACQDVRPNSTANGPTFRSSKRL